MVSSAAVVACTFTVTPLSHASPASGDSFSVGVTASAPSCSWTASSDQPWAIASAAGGAGSGTLTLTVGANGTSAPRNATVTVAGSAVAITEAAPVACTFSVTPLLHDSPAGGDSFSVSVTASAPSCGWTASSDQPWATASAPAGTGSSTLMIAVGPNGTSAPRTATMSVAGQGLVITEAAPVAAPVCTFTLSPSSFTVSRTGTTFAATLTASDAVVRLERSVERGVDRAVVSEGHRQRFRLDHGCGDDEQRHAHGHDHRRRADADRAAVRAEKDSLAPRDATRPALVCASSCRGRFLVRDPPDPPCAVVGDEHGAVLQNGDADGPAPHLRRVLPEHPADDEVLVPAPAWPLVNGTNTTL